MFIVFEGIDGSGSTTQARLLAEALQKRKIPSLHTSEPTDRSIGKLIRHILQGKEKLSPRTLQLLFVTDRAEHLVSVILPALEKKKAVICDRYVWSTIAYGSLHCDSVWLRRINSRFPKPDFTFLLDVPPEVCLERIRKRKGRKELFEKKEKLRKVTRVFYELSRKEPRSALLDGKKSPQEVTKEALRILEENGTMPSL